MDATEIIHALYIWYARLDKIKLGKEIIQCELSQVNMIYSIWLGATPLATNHG